MMTIVGAGTPWQVEIEKVEQRCDYLLSSGLWSDCTFEVGSEPNKTVVPVHKLILSMASPVFEAMLDGGHKEPMLTVSDVEPEAFRALLQYIYTGRTDITSFDMARDLWFQAKKYMLPHLEKKCKSYVCSVVGPRNACRIYELARLLEEKSLMNICIQIISANTKEVLNDSSFVDVKLDTVLTVFSLSDLELDSELDLFHAVAKYDEAQRMQGRSISPAGNGDGPPSEELSKNLEPHSEDKASEVNVESSSQNSPAVELDSKKPSEKVVTSEPPAGKENSKVTKYDEALRMQGRSISPPVNGDGQRKEELSENLEPHSEDKASEVNVESSSQNSPAVEIDSKKPSEKVVTSEPPAGKENSKVTKYDEALRMQGRSISPPVNGDGQRKEELSENLEPHSEDKASEVNVESSSQNSPAVELDSKKPSEKVVTSEPPAGKENSKVTKYDEALRMQGRSISPPVNGDGQRKEELSENLEPHSEDKASEVNVESSSQNSPAVEIDSKKPSEKVVTSEPPASKGNSKEEVPTIRAAIEKIRFLTLTAQQFADGPARSGLLTKEESFAVLMNIASKASAVPMPAGFSKRRHRRHHYEVDQEPIAKPLLKPSPKSRVVTAKKWPTPDEIVKDFASQDRYTMRAAARATRILSADNGGDAKETLHELVKAGIIPLLVNALDEPCSGLQYDAVVALSHFTLAEDYIEAVVDEGAVAKLVALLDRGGKLAEQAALNLGHIAQSYSNEVVERGALPALISHMEPGTPFPQLESYLWTYRMICEHKEAFEQEPPIFPYIKNLLALDDELVLEEACWILYNLTDDLIASYESEHELIARLAALLGHADAYVQVAALMALENMLKNQKLKEQCLGAGCLDHIINLLKCGNPFHVVNAVRVADYILTNSPLHIQEALDKRILEPLGRILTEGHARSKKQVVEAMTSLCSMSSPSQLRELAYSTALEPYCRLLANDHYSYDVVRGLKHLLQNIEENARDALCLKLLEFEVPKLLLPMLEHEDELVCVRAEQVLKTYFGDVNEKGRLH